MMVGSLLTMAGDDAGAGAAGAAGAAGTAVLAGAAGAAVLAGAAGAAGATVLLGVAVAAATGVLWLLARAYAVVPPRPSTRTEPRAVSATVLLVQIMSRRSCWQPGRRCRRRRAWSASAGTGSTAASGSRRTCRAGPGALLRAGQPPAVRILAGRSLVPGSCS